MRPIRTALLALVAAASLLSTPGCASVEDAKAKRTELLNHKTDLEQASANLADAKAAAEARQAELEQHLAQTQALLDDTQDASARHELEVTIAGIRTEVARAAGQAAAAQVQIAAAEVQITGATAGIKTLDAAIAEFENPTDPLNQAVQGALPFLPEPVRLPLAWGATIGALLWRSGKLKTALTSVVKSFEVLKTQSPQVAHAIEQHAKTLRKIQTPTARKVVDQVQTAST